MRACDFKVTLNEDPETVTISCRGCGWTLGNWEKGRNMPVRKCGRQHGLGEAIHKGARVLHIQECGGCKNRRRIANRVSDAIVDVPVKVVKKVAKKVRRRYDGKRRR